MSVNTNIPYTNPDIFTSKDELELIWNNTNDAIFLIAPNGSVLKANPAFERVLGYTAEELVNDPTPPIIPDYLIKDQKPFLDQMHKGEKILYYEAQRVTKNGKLIDIVSSYCPVLDEQGDLLLIVAMYKDVTKQVEAQRLLVENENKYRFIAENTSDLIQVLDKQGIITYISPSIQTILGYTASEYRNNNIVKWIYEGDVPHFLEMLNQLKTTEEPFKTEVRYLHANGSIVWMEVKASYVFDNDEPKTMIVSRDISDRKKYEEELKYLAFHDTLTGLPNRYQFTELLKEEMAIAKATLQTMLVMYIDIDHFKQVNDYYGHAAGDTVLVEFSKRLQDSFRTSDQVCRISGDEFVSILSAPATSETASSIAKVIHEKLKNPILISGKEVFITTSIGIASFHGENLSPEDLIKRADSALYQSKDNGKNTYTFWKA
ncbi:diguanylate cyclase domain-containing protein [Bacillus sp. AK128]